jgi:uncharacterized membrane protein YraQ (UPF0718 family)
MTDIPQPQSNSQSKPYSGGRSAPVLATFWKRTDKALLTIALLLAGVLLVAPGDLPDILGDSAVSLLHTAPFIAVAVLAVAGMKATGAERLVARAFEGRESRMIFLAAIMGGLAPFCSCEIIPFIAALLALGVPLSAVMALWLASPLMDPAMFAVTAGAIGLDFALAKTVAAIGIGAAGGFLVMAFARSPVFADPLREQPVKSGCCSRKAPFSGAPVWRFWADPERRAAFADTARTNAAFLLKWLALAYVLEAMMLRYVPAGWIAGVLGGDGIWPILLGAAVGGPAYLNGYAAVPLVGGLLEQGMSPGAAMSFVIAGGVSCIPAAVAVWALVKPRVFAAYLGIGLAGAVAAGMAWSALA